MRAECLQFYLSLKIYSLFLFSDTEQCCPLLTLIAGAWVPDIRLRPAHGGGVPAGPGQGATGRRRQGDDDYDDYDDDNDDDD